MTEQIQARQRRQGTAAAERTEEGRDLRDEQLDEDVACCLAEIDKVLEKAASEREQAQREWNVLKAREKAIGDPEDTVLLRDLRLWQAKYAHLGIRTGLSCCGIYAFDKEGVHF